MSYKYSVLADSPIMFYETVTASANLLSTYQEVLDVYDNYEDFLDAYQTYGTILANTIFDISLCLVFELYFSSKL